MRLEIDGKNTDRGVYADGKVIGFAPDRTEESETGNRLTWIHIYEDVPSNAIVVCFGYNSRGESWFTAKHVDGSALSQKELNTQVRILPEYQGFS